MVFIKYIYAITLNYSNYTCYNSYVHELANYNKLKCQRD